MKVLIMVILYILLLWLLPVWGNSDISELRQRYEEEVDQEINKIRDKVVTDYLGEDYTEEEVEELEDYLWREQERRKQRAIEKWKRTQELN